MSDKGITKFLYSHASKKPVSFHMPGHKGARFYKRNGYGRFMKNIADLDITEIPGADNLFQTEGIIRETSEKYAGLYGVAKSYLLINGTSSGLIASILATVPKGGKIIMARNCHKSVFNALSLGNITPVYAYPEVIFRYGISGAVSPDEIERLCEENPDATAVILPSPNYYGICSDIKAIAKAAHRHGKVLIVDQAHGAHLKFFSSFGLRRSIVNLPGGGKVSPVDVRKGAEAQAEYYKDHGSGLSLGETGWKWSMPMCAEECGADIVVNSIHKTLGSFTESAVLNVSEDALEAGDGTPGVDLAVLEDRLQAIQSTSPSYLLMASLDINADIIEKNGKKLFAEWKRNITWFFRKAVTIPELRVMTVEADEKSLVAEAAEKSIDRLRKIPGFRGNKTQQLPERQRQTGSLDTTKINIDMSAYGIDGNRLEGMLNEKGIFPELVTGNIVMLMTGIGNRRKDFKRLYKALAEIAFTNRGSLVKLSSTERLEYEARPEIPAPGSGTGSTANSSSSEEARQLRESLVTRKHSSDTMELSDEQVAQINAAAKEIPVAAGSTMGQAGSSFAAKTAALWSKRRPLHEIPEKKETLPLDECVGRICAVSVIPYPPGIPLVCPGEEIGREEIEYIKYLRHIGDKVIGVNADGEIVVGK